MERGRKQYEQKREGNHLGLSNQPMIVESGRGGNQLDRIISR